MQFSTAFFSIVGLLAVSSGACKTGAWRCEGQHVQQCNGAWKTTSTCGAGTHCVSNGQTAHCEA